MQAQFCALAVSFDATERDNRLPERVGGGMLEPLTGACLFGGRPRRLGASASQRFGLATGGAMFGDSNGLAATGIGGKAAQQLSMGGAAPEGCDEQVMTGFVSTASLVMHWKPCAAFLGAAEGSRDVGGGCRAPWSGAAPEGTSLTGAPGREGAS